MQTKIMQNLKFLSFSIALGIVLGAGIVAVSAWTEPTGSAPSGNLGAPLNISGSAQVKSGALQVNGFRNKGKTILDGNVGVGTVAPNSRLTVSGGSIEIYNDGADNKIRFQDPNDMWFSVGLDQSDGNKFKINKGAEVGSNTQFVMTSDGKVGIGTAAPTQKMDVVGYVKGQTGLCIGNDCRTAWPSASGTISLTNCYNKSDNGDNDGWDMCASGEVMTGVMVSGNGCDGECVNTEIRCCRIRVD